MQASVTLSGTIKDKSSGEVLIGAVATLAESKQSVAANTFGFYSLSAVPGTYTVRFTCLGYETVTQTVQLDNDRVLNIELMELTRELESVEIKADKSSDNVKKIEMSVSKLDIKTISKIPAFLGEVDIVRAVQLLPGVTTVGEGATGFNVRGGNIDQNLILLDDAPVFNSSHVFGFFSVFNPDAVRDVKLIKGGIPANYGGRLSSVLDVRMKDGNIKTYNVHAGVGLLFSRLSIEGPIKKDKASFILAGRRSYFDQFFRFAGNNSLKNSIAYFYDLTAKANLIINDNNRLFLSSYSGRDKFGFGGANGFGWNNGNNTVTVRYNHVFNKKIFSNVSAIYSKYDYQIGVGDTYDGFTWTASINNYSIKPEFTWYANSKNQIVFGGSSTYYRFDPGILLFYSKGEKRENGSANKFSLENALYAGNEQTLSSKWSLQYGIRFSQFMYLGPGTAYYFKDTVSDYSKPTSGSQYFHAHKKMAAYNNLEPRFSVKYELNEFSSIKASFNRMAQYVHLISNTTASTPFDVWLPSTNNIRPQLANQTALGYFRNFGKDEMFESSVEVYYKTVPYLVDYVNGANLFLNPLVEGELLAGQGRAMGFEFFLKKNAGKVTGFISYTLSKSETKAGTINNGEWYPNRFDRRHNLNTSLSYDITQKITASANVVYASGTPATFPTNRINLQGYIIPLNVDNLRNNARIPDYHRLDLSCIIKMKPLFKNKYNHNLVFTLYNVYGRKNPFTIYFRGNAENPQNTEAIRFSILGVPVPAVTYNLNF